MHIEALNTYSIMTKNKMFPHVNQLKLNMGNIYYKMGIYPKAIKMYRMALDSVPNNLKQLRLKITQNIGILFVRMGQYADAASSFEFIMSERADIRSGIHLILCYYAMGDVEKIKNTFRNLCETQPTMESDDLENESNIIKLQQHANAVNENMEDSVAAQAGKAEVAIFDGSDVTTKMNNNNAHQRDSGSSTRLSGITPSSSSGGGGAAAAAVGGSSFDRFGKNSYVVQALKSDELAIYTKQRRNNEKRAITMIVDLISPLIEENYNDGKWLMRHNTHKQYKYRHSKYRRQLPCHSTCSWPVYASSFVNPCGLISAFRLQLVH